LCFFDITRFCASITITSQRKTQHLSDARFVVNDQYVSGHDD
jgi:hypothetical protein